MNEFKWTDSEKKIANRAFEKARITELDEVVQFFKAHAAKMAVPVGLGDDGKVVKLAHHLEQVPGPQALEPERSAPAASQAGQKERSRCVLSEMRPKDGRVGQLAQNALPRFRWSHL